MCNFNFFLRSLTVAGSSTPVSMSESYLDIIKEETTGSYIWVKTVDGSIQRVEEEVAMCSAMIRQEVALRGVGTSKNHAVLLSEKVNQDMLSSILEFIRFHIMPERSDMERTNFNKKFMGMHKKRLWELGAAASSLEVQRLVDLTSSTISRTLGGKTPEEMREIFNLPDDLTEEEKLEPVKNTVNDTRIRLLNQLNAKKRTELKEGETLKNVEVEEHVEERSVDDLVSFINGGDAKVVKKSKGKKKNKKKKGKKIVSADEKEGAEETGTSTREEEVEAPNLPSPEDDIFWQMAASKDDDTDDEMDPARKEMLDKEVEDFARRLEASHAIARAQGQVRVRAHFTMNVKGTKDGI